MPKSMKGSGSVEVPVAAALSTGTAASVNPFAGFSFSQTSKAGNDVWMLVCGQVC